MMPPSEQAGSTEKDKTLGRVNGQNCHTDNHTTIIRRPIMRGYHAHAQPAR